MDDQIKFEQKKYDNLKNAIIEEKNMENQKNVFVPEINKNTKSFVKKLEKKGITYGSGLLSAQLNERKKK